MFLVKNEYSFKKGFTPWNKGTNFKRADWIIHFQKQGKLLWQ